jgi:hypothetical protein
MEMAEKMGLVGFDILREAKAAVNGREGAPKEKNQLHGVKRIVAGVY